MKKFTRDETVKILHESSIAYREKLAGRVFAVIYQDSSAGAGTAWKRIVFSESNFAHLTGVCYAEQVTPKVFFQMCCNNRLSPTKVRFRKDGVTHLKLAVLSDLAEVLYHKFWIGISLHNDVYINADYFVGDTKNRLSLGIRQTGNKDVPVSLKNQSVRDNVDVLRKVYAVYSKRVGTKEAWACVYVDEKIVHEINQDVLPQDIRDAMK
jgi:hypothetical protein